MNDLMPGQRGTIVRRGKRSHGEMEHLTVHYVTERKIIIGGRGENKELFSTWD